MLVVVPGDLRSDVWIIVNVHDLRTRIYPILRGIKILCLSTGTSFSVFKAQRYFDTSPLSVRLDC
jgi:hypothetical protein